MLMHPPGKLFSRSKPLSPPLRELVRLLAELAAEEYLKGPKLEQSGTKMMVPAISSEQVDTGQLC